MRCLLRQLENLYDQLPEASLLFLDAALLERHIFTLAGSPLHVW